MKFAVKTATCLGCKVPLRKNQSAVCEHCKPRTAELHRKQLDAASELEVRFARLWTQCQRCQGSLHQDVICTAQDCPIFYMRKKVQKDIGDSFATLQRCVYGSFWFAWQEVHCIFQVRLLMVSYNYQSKGRSWIVSAMVYTYLDTPGLV